MKHFIPQISNHDCGFASLKILLSILYRNDAYLLLNNTYSKPFSYQDLKELALKYRVRLSGIKFIKKGNILKFRNLPIIVSLKRNNGSLHAVVVTKINRLFVSIKDPDKGCYKMSFKRFINIWDGTCLFPEKVIKEKQFLSVEKESTKKHDYFSIAAQILSNLSLFVSIMLINNKIPILYPIMFFVLFAIFEICQKIILFSKVRKIDDFYLSRIDYKKRGYKESYSLLEDYKKTLFLDRGNMFINLIAIVMFCVIVLINNPINYILIIIPVFLLVLNSLFFKNKDDEKLEQLAYLEKDLNDIKGEKRAISLMKAIQKRGYEFSRKSIVRKYVFFSIMILTSLVTMALTVPTMNLVHVIFYFSIEMLLYEQFNKIITHQSSKIESLRKMMRLRSIMRDKDEKC
jgi:predicted double-glycine peptidase